MPTEGQAAQLSRTFGRVRLVYNKALAARITAWHDQARRVRVARIHARIVDRRRDLLHQVSTRLVRENQTIVIEDLAVRNMVRNRCLARAISDATWYGREVIAVDRWLPSSKTRSACGQVKAVLSLGERVFRCEECPLVLDRDINAACNIVAAGRAVLAGGDGVRPTRR